jgi:hypothetical protein
MKESLTLPYDANPIWVATLFFVMLSGPALGLANRGKGGAVAKEELALFKRALVKCNGLGPRFVVLCGPLTGCSPGEEGCVAACSAWAVC